MLTEPVLGSLIIRRQDGNDIPEFGAVVVLDKMSNFLASVCMSFVIPPAFDQTHRIDVL